MAFRFPKAGPRAEQEVQVLPENGRFLARKNPSDEKYLNCKYLSFLGRYFLLRPRGISFT
jgi:hypothetical protein